MKSNKYNELIFNTIIEESISSNYLDTVGRQLSVFSSDENKMLYIESKAIRILEDYAIHSPIYWKNNKTGNVLYNKKENKISLSSSSLEKRMDKYLTDIPFLLATHLQKETNKQDLIEFSINDWLAFITPKFFNTNVSLGNKINIEKLVDTKFGKEIKENKLFKQIDKDSFKTFVGENGRSFLVNIKNEKSKLFYICFGKRHHLFKIN